MKPIRTTVAMLGIGLFGAGLGGCVAAPPPLANGYSQQCFAGAYLCAAPPGPPGAPCSCPGLGAPSYGTLR